MGLLKLVEKAVTKVYDSTMEYSADIIEYVDKYKYLNKYQLMREFKMIKLHQRLDPIKRTQAIQYIVVKMYNQNWDEFAKEAMKIEI